MMSLRGRIVISATTDQRTVYTTTEWKDKLLLRKAIAQVVIVVSIMILY